jgi:hypothetical protein
VIDLTIRLGEGSNARREIALALITGVLDEALRAGKITMPPLRRYYPARQRR